MFPSACVWSHQIPIAATLRQLKETAFHYIDVEPENLEVEGVKETIAELGLRVSCVALDHHMPQGASLSAGRDTDRRNAMQHIAKGLAAAAAAGAQAAYLQPWRNGKDSAAYRAAATELATLAAQNGIKLCIEHSPDSSLPAAADVLRFVSSAGHENLFLLLDLGHLLLSKEQPCEVIAAARDKIGYVQVDDNDGKKDRHWPLLDGLYTDDALHRAIQALAETGYAGTLGLELSREIPSLISGLSKNRNLLLRLQLETEPKSLKEPEARRKQ
jgi:sugar phosphate isomerase/epimerase